MAAVDFFERTCSITIAPRNYQLTLDGFPPRAGRIRLPRPPATEVTSISFQSIDGQKIQLTPSQHELHLGNPSYITPVMAWPPTSQSCGSVNINFSAGYRNEESAPPLLIQGCYLLVEHWHKQRGATSDRQARVVPFAVQSILENFAFTDDPDLLLGGLSFAFHLLVLSGDQTNDSGGSVFVTSTTEACLLIQATASSEPMRGLTREGRRLEQMGRFVPDAEIRWELSGLARSVLYQFVLETSLRRGAIARLVVSDFDLSTTQTSTVVVRPKANTKNRRLQVIPLKPELARLISLQLENKARAALAFVLPKVYETADLVRADLARARRA